jgi:hypothetical protein
VHATVLILSEASSNSKWWADVVVDIWLVLMQWQLEAFLQFDFAN